MFKKYESEVTESRKILSDIDVEFDMHYKRVLFRKYFQIIAQNGNLLTAVCRFCSFVLIVEKSSTFETLTSHLNVCIL